jgi:hypothetical protein
VNSLRRVHILLKMKEMAVDIILGVLAGVSDAAIVRHTRTSRPGAERKVVGSRRRLLQSAGRATGSMHVSRKTTIQRLTQAHWRHGRRAVLPGATLRTILPLVTLFLGLSPISRADDFWKHKPPAQWSSAEALKIVSRSPWARLDVVVFFRQEPQASYSIPTGTKHCDPDAIDQNGNCMQKGRVEAPVDSSQQPDAAPNLSPSTGFLVRWESAAPVRQAFARLDELGERAVVAFQARAPRLPADRYVITVKNEQPGRAGFEPFAVTPGGKPVLRATLKTRRGTVAPLEVEFTGTGASSSVHFLFPRTLDGASLLGSGRESAEFRLQGAGFAVRSKFTLDLEFLE